jgi:DNA-binding NarL/FixJ family response regulator
MCLKEEIAQIELLVKEGSSNKDIAERLERTIDGIRNIRHRMNLKSETKKSIQYSNKIEKHYL